VLDILTPYAEKMEAKLSEVIGVAEADFSNENVRKQETELGDLEAKSARKGSMKSSLSMTRW
jgi:2',3'-cyclic-nucleotide 2'-phosphodiesterase (5'-nucleotidase family)